jgi:hypothetical protein
MDIIELFDRFVFGPEMRYPLEWDDFISWESGNLQAEEVRLRLGEHERLLFSQDKALMKKYSVIVVEERNRLAVILGIPTRELPID